VILTNPRTRRPHTPKHVISMLRVPRVVTGAEIKWLASVEGPVVGVVESSRVPVDLKSVSFKHGRCVWEEESYFEHKLGDRHRVAGRASVSDAGACEGLGSGNGVSYMRFVVGGVQVLAVPAAFASFISTVFCEKEGVAYVG